MSFIEHLEDLRWHIIRTLVVIVACSVFFLIRPDIIFDKVILGPKDLPHLSGHVCTWRKTQSEWSLH